MEVLRVSLQVASEAGRPYHEVVDVFWYPWGQVGLFEYFSDAVSYDVFHEGDSVFEKLRIWLVDTQGNEVLEDLKDEDVGAIYLGRLNTGFDRKDSGNRLQGRITDSGLYLKEDGTPGTIQELDLAV